MKGFLFTLATILTLCSCNNQQKEQEYNLRVARLAEKEQQFSEKEAEYQILLQLRDSLENNQPQKKEFLLWPENIAGRWNTKSKCINSNCSDYAVGDVRTDLWDFVSMNGRLVVNNYSNQTLVRTYQAEMNEKTIDLRFITDSTSKKFVEMTISLDQFSENKIAGTRKVTVNHNCEANFTVELARP